MTEFPETVDVIAVLYREGNTLVADLSTQSAQVKVYMRGSQASVEAMAILQEATAAVTSLLTEFIENQIKELPATDLTRLVAEGNLLAIEELNRRRSDNGG